ncbi:AraC family transcriptional regulator [Vallitalea okinawensis]|uniref:AraC family transcriptional regulator n=1 Tax=Vallitalea okinawensis TaxID=2078660 RepID=UPI000CFC2EE4|nr:helix-turn-helix domain-containing protein [Vallitalea okinawensis]
MVFFDYSDQELSIIKKNLNKIIFDDVVINDAKIKILGIHFNYFEGELYIKKHRHSFFEYSYAIRNNMTITANSKEFRVKEGQFYMLPKGVYHTHHVAENCTYNAISIRWEFSRSEKKDIHKNWFRKINNFEKASSRPVSDNGQVHLAIKNLLELARNNQTELELKLSFCQLLLSILNFYMNDDSQSNIEEDHLTVDHNVVNMALDFIDTNYQTINVHDVADSVYLSYSHLSRLFNKYIHKTINTCITEAKLKQAQILLMTTNKTITQIAWEVGFKNENYFSKVFRNYYGLLPRDMQKNKTELNE